LLTTVPLQIFAAELASAKGYDVDQPRNLAKSVTRRVAPPFRVPLSRRLFGLFGYAGSDEAVRAYAEYVFYVPETPTLLMPLLTTVPLQIFAAELASAKGYDVDQPRNLAKSVT
ncbi:hypothetical protein CTI14_54960, partial [Methylobacterium radiotolerans]